MSVTIVGAGPGDPGLLTLRAAQALRDADVVLYDALVSAAVLDMASPQCERVYVGKRCGVESITQGEIIRRMLAEASRGRHVVRLKGGDPFLFGRGGEEVEAVAAAGIACTVVPGVSSALAVPGSAGIPLTQRGVSSAVAIVTGAQEAQKEQRVDWRRLAGFGGTIVVLMGARSFASIARELIAGGMPPSTPVAAIENGTLPQERAVTGSLACFAQGRVRPGLRGPTTIVIGEVVALRARIAHAG